MLLRYHPFFPDGSNLYGTTLPYGHVPDDWTAFRFLVSMIPWLVFWELVEQVTTHHGIFEFSIHHTGAYVGYMNVCFPEADQLHAFLRVLHWENLPVPPPDSPHQGYRNLCCFGSLDYHDVCDAAIAAGLDPRYPVTHPSLNPSPPLPPYPHPLLMSPY